MSFVHWNKNMHWSWRVFYHSALLYQLDYLWYFLIHLRPRLFLFFLFSAFFPNKRLKGFSEFHFPKKEQLEWKFAFHKERTWKDKIGLLYILPTLLFYLYTCYHLRFDGRLQTVAKITSSDTDNNKAIGNMSSKPDFWRFYWMAHFSYHLPLQPLVGWSRQ